MNKNEEFKIEWKSFPKSVLEETERQLKELENKELKNQLENLFKKYGYENCSVKEIKERKNFIFLICNESTPFGDEVFHIQYKNGKFLNVNGDDLEEMYKLNK